MVKIALPTVSIKGKDYVLVKDRVLAFREKYPEGIINTILVSPHDSNKIVIRAEISIREGQGANKLSYLVATGHSQATVGDGYINTTSAMENAETSAVGRALAFLGIGVIESVASADEINKATGSRKSSKTVIEPADTDKPPFGPGSDEDVD